MPGKHRLGGVVGKHFEKVADRIQIGQSLVLDFRLRFEHDVPTAQEVVVRDVDVEQGPIANHAWTPRASDFEVLDSRRRFEQALVGYDDESAPENCRGALPRAEESPELIDFLEAEREQIHGQRELDDSALRQVRTGRIGKRELLLALKKGQHLRETPERGPVVAIVRRKQQEQVEVKRPVRVADVAGADGGSDPAVLERPLFLEIHKAQDEMVFELRRDFRAIELRDVAPHGLSGHAGAILDLRDVLIELPQEQGHRLDNHGQRSPARSATACGAGVGSMRIRLPLRPRGRSNRLNELAWRHLSEIDASRLQLVLEDPVAMRRDHQRVTARPSGQQRTRAFAGIGIAHFHHHDIWRQLLVVWRRARARPARGSLPCRADSIWPARECPVASSGRRGSKRGFWASIRQRAEYETGGGPGTIRPTMQIGCMRRFTDRLNPD